MKTPLDFRSRGIGGVAPKNALESGSQARVVGSINETLPRTVLTSGTTLVVLGALLVVGGAVVRDFTGVLILGVTVGTYSSIFVASPALLEIQKRFGDGTAGRERRKKGGARATA